MRVRNELRRIRNVRGFAASALSKEVGISRQTIYAIESGQYLPNTATALRLARALQVSVEQLFFLEKKRRAIRR
jgi:DNA-binding XRE family transcriptional regulator